jgi:hypothetical protein
MAITADMVKAARIEVLNAQRDLQRKQQALNELVIQKQIEDIEAQQV